MKLNVRKQTRWVGLFSQFIITLSLVFFLVGFLGSNNYIALNSPIQTKLVILGAIIVFGVVSVYLLITNFMISRKLDMRKKHLLRKSFEIGMQPSTIKLSAALYQIADDTGKYRDLTVKNSYTADDWGYGDYQFSRYKKSKNGKYNVATYYYSVGVFALPRKLPNVFFDSHKTGAREFGLLFNSSQKHSLESVFDDYFTSYFHEDYTIDNLSFITPEVMEALIAAEQYDIEIYQDRLYLYNELENMPGQLLDVQEKGNLIRKKLLNNIYTYRDERIDFADGRKTVSVLGVSLQRSLNTYYIRLVAASVLLVGLIVGLLVIGSDAMNRFYLYAIFVSIFIVLKNKRKIRSIKRDEASARKRVAEGA